MPETTHSLTVADLQTRSGTETLWVLELDTEYNHVQVGGPAEVSFYPTMVESLTTGGGYMYDEGSNEIGGVHQLSAEEHRLSLFADQASFEAGVVEMAKIWQASEGCPVALIKLAARFTPNGSRDILGI